MTERFAALLLGTVLDRLVGDPDWLWRRLPHPVALIGAAIAFLERRLNRPALSPARRRRGGIAAAALLVLGSIATGLLLQGLFDALLGPLAFLGEALVLGLLLAGNSLAQHVRAVREALEAEGPEGGRRAVAMIVGRDPDLLDAAGICRAAIESLAENASDGFVAPWLFFLAFGLPGLLAYKAVNTADSMIGHLNERYRDFGWASARLDDLLNLAPARLTAALFALAAARRSCWRAAAETWRIARRDAGLHRSPNAGWPESAAAGALGLALGGPRRYGALAVEAPKLHAEGRFEATPADIGAALGLYAALCDLVLGLSVLGAVLVLP
ncbi:adenosylcobinamide-phosphate synthase CbiB [Aurantimonas sp. Leaf443]|uniref:adenosylcobinamide-phosphate synthase CbiB n=1 Tax=Aurantimonas sp. Leaf443 TaxID=1736378 RepID=UPI0006F813CF|nr:adenosylcobinamide-phosphate synthase CbiB [Aurantimonas sp. Leaf443]KQT83083.1 hypothetical protein ASG48_13975 [Aurantimonas sp. Leaf443]